ncbi:unnamed protein product [Dicrocoelium dendriticum]|nr:unnamed protein product [Dicrocoelium dendriticum]
MVSKLSATCNQSVSSVISSVDRMLHNGLLDTACNKLFDFHCHKAGKPTLRLDSSARSYIVDYTASIVKNLCDPSVPLSISDVNDRIHYSFPPKLIPPDHVIDEIKTLIDRGKKKTLYLPADKVLSSFRAICFRIEPSVSLFITHLIEYALGQIIQWAVNYESKLDSGLIEDTDIQHISSLFGTHNFSKTSISQSLPFLQRHSGDYAGHAKELQFFLRSCVEHLAIIVRVFTDPIGEELTQLALATQSAFINISGGCELTLAADQLSLAVHSAQRVFSCASELYNNMTLLSECVEDVFEGHSRLLGTSLIEPAEDETFHSFAYYSEELFSSDCRNWTYLLSEVPCLIKALNNLFQSILCTVIEKASSRRLVDLEVRYSDPHTCTLCTSSTGSDPGAVPYSTGTSSSASCSNSHLNNSPQPLHSLGSFLLHSHENGSCSYGPKTSYVSDPPGSIPVPTASSGRYDNRHAPSSSCHSHTHRHSQDHQHRCGHFASSVSTTMPLRKHKKTRISRRSVSGSPSPAPLSFIPGSSATDPSTKPVVFTDISGSEPGMSTSSSSSSALNDGMTTRSSQDSGSHSFEHHHHHLGFTGSDEQSPSDSSVQEIHARLMEVFPSRSSSATGSASCSHMVIAFRYLLPQLLQLPPLQLLHLHEIIETLYQHAVEESERSLLKDVLSMLSKTRLSIQNSMSTQDWIKTTAPRLVNFLKTPLTGCVLSPEARGNLEELVQSVRRIQHSSERSISVSEYILDGFVQIRSEGSRFKRSDRIAYLFNNWLLLCKKQRRVLGTVVGSVGSSAHSGLKVKKRIPLEQFHLIDSGTEISDNNDVFFTFELEYWEFPRRGSLAPDLLSKSIVSIGSDQLPPPANARNVPPASIALSTLPTSITTTNTSCSQLGSVLSISTLTSTNTLVDGSSVSTGVATTTATTDSADSAAVSTFAPLVPTAGAAVAAASAAVLGALSSARTQRVIFVFSSQTDKSDWLAALVYLQLGRLFKRYIRDLPRQDIPLVLPPPEVYRFSAPDSITTIIFESDQQDSSAEIPVIRAATMLKLIERMTYHAYFDRNTINVFLLTYRRYISPQELLELLIERFNVPEPDFAEAAEQAQMLCDKENAITVAIRLEKRFRSIYKRRVQYRVLNFLIKWVKNPSYYKLDISTNEAVRNRLWEFLDTVDARNLQDNVANIRKSLRGDRTRLIQIIQQLPPDPLDLGLVTRAEEVKLTNVHPLELARQITLHEWELYSRIEFWEVNGKEKTKAPNLQASLDFSNKIKWWLVYSIMSAEHLEDRLIVMQRVADLATLFEVLNNLEGFQEARAALLSSPVFRLHSTYEALLTKSRPHHRAFFENLRRSAETEDGDAYVTDYEKKLHELNPPGLPFIAVGDKTHLIHLELKHPDWITVPNTQGASLGSEDAGSRSLINFWKCHQLADLVEYYLSFQQTPYNFTVNEHIRNFLLTFDPLRMAGVSDEHSFDDLMHEKSLQFQPRHPAEPLLVTERQLSVVEQRIASMLSANPPDHRLTADSKEFRSLLHVASLASTSSTAASTNALSSSISSGASADSFSMKSIAGRSPPVDAFSTLITSTESLGRGRTRQCDGRVLQMQPTSISDRLQLSMGHLHSQCCRPRHPIDPSRGVRSASSSPAPANPTGLANLTVNFPTNVHLTHSAYASSPPPPLPPRTIRFKATDQHLEHFVNQGLVSSASPSVTNTECTRSYADVPSANPLPDSTRYPSRLCSAIGDSTVLPPAPPPRPLQRKCGSPFPADSIVCETDSKKNENTSKRTGSFAASSLMPDSSTVPSARPAPSHCPQQQQQPPPQHPGFSLDSPPVLPPRVHCRGHSSFSSSHSLASSTSNTVDTSGRVGVSDVPPDHLPPPLPPKRQAAKSGVSQP